MCIHAEAYEFRSVFVLFVPTGILFYDFASEPTRNTKEPENAGRQNEVSLSSVSANTSEETMRDTADKFCPSLKVAFAFYISRSMNESRKQIKRERNYVKCICFSQEKKEKSLQINFLKI